MIGMTPEQGVSKGLHIAWPVIGPSLLCEGRHQDAKAQNQAKSQALAPMTGAAFFKRLGLSKQHGRVNAPRVGRILDSHAVFSKSALNQRYIDRH